MISEIVPTEKDLEDDFFNTFVSDNQEDIDVINEYYFWIAEFLASKFSKLGVGLDELETEAYYALLDAACSYKPDECTRFGIYAIPLIREKLVNLISDTAMKSLGIKQVSDILYKAKNLSNMVSNNVLNDTTDWKAAKALDIDEAALNELIFGQLNISSPKELFNKSKESVRQIANTQSKKTSSLINNVSGFFDNLLDNFEE